MSYQGLQGGFGAAPSAQTLSGYWHDACNWSRYNVDQPDDQVYGICVTPNRSGHDVRADTWASEQCAAGKHVYASQPYWAPASPGWPAAWTIDMASTAVPLPAGYTAGWEGRPPLEPYACPAPPPAPPTPPLPPAPPPSASSSSEDGVMARAVQALAGVSIIGLVVWYFVKKKKYKRNAPRGKRARAKQGKIVTLKSGKRFGHKTPPKRYWEMGAKRQSDYAWPDGYKYPLVFRASTGKVNRAKTKAHIRSAQAYYARSRTKYPPKVRRTIARRINLAKKKYGVGGEAVSP